MKFEIPIFPNSPSQPMCLALHNSPSPRGLGGLPPSLALLPLPSLLTAGCQPAALSEFLLKCNIALKECSETRFWLDLLTHASIFPPSRLSPLRTTCTDLLRMLASTCKTTQERLAQQ